MRLAGSVMCLLTVVAGSLGAEEWRPGTEAELGWEGSADPLRVYVPKNYDAGVAAPVIFFYHGTNGRPNFGALLEHTGGRDFVLVGMTYLKRGNLDGSEANLRAELDQLFAVRDKLGERLNLDGRRVYIAGFSKGGWLASMVGEFGIGRLRGALIMGAGTTARAPDLRPEAAKRRPAGSYPVYVGVGQWDGNYMMGVRSIRHFSEIGCEVTFDPFPGIAHGMAERSEYLAQWLAVEAAGQDLDAVEKKAAGWWMRRRAQVGKLGALERYLLVKQVMRAPYYGLLGEAARGEIEGMLAGLRADAGLAGELEAEAKFLAVLGEEVKEHSTAGLMGSMKKYRALATALPETHFGKEAFMQWRRCHLLAANSVAKPLPGVVDLPEFKRFAEAVAEGRPDAARASEVEGYFLEIGERLYAEP